MDPAVVDVLVAGSGPAGLATARVLAAAGVRVLLVDARARIGHPLRCGELTRPEFFDFLGIAPRPKWVRWRFTEPPGLVLDRPRLEAEAAEILAQRGVQVSAGSSVVGVGAYDGVGRRVTLATGQARREVHAKLVVAADGVSSRVARMAGIDTRVRLDQLGACLAYRMTGVEVASAEPVLAYRAESRPFYFWIIQSGREEANVGIGVGGSRGFAARPILDALVASTPGLRRGRVVERIVGLFPSAPPLEQPYADGLLVVGTAARLVDGATGEGIVHAALSGREAARVFLGAHGVTTAARLAPYRQLLGPLYQELGRALERRAARERTRE